MDEMSQLTRFRSEVPRPELIDLRVEESRLRLAMCGPTVDAPMPRRRRRVAYVLVAGLAAAAVVAGIVAGADMRGKERRTPTVMHAMPVAFVDVLSRAAANVANGPDLRPARGQFFVFESEMMNEVDSTDQDGHKSRWLSRQRRKVWLPVEGDATRGVLESDELAPAPYPGVPIPAVAYRGLGPSGPSKLADTDGRASYLRTDYAYLSRLPTVPAKMYEHLYTGLGTGPLADAQAWNLIGVTLTESYMPAAQRAALFRAAEAIPGVITIKKATDAAGRTGVAAARVDTDGSSDEYIFDPKTYQFLGARNIVVNAKLAGIPAGSVLSSTAQLSVSLSDQAPTPHGG